MRINTILGPTDQSFSVSTAVNLVIRKAGGKKLGFDPSFQFFHDSFQTPIRYFFDFVLPKSQYFPTVLPQPPVNIFIPSYISFDFFKPEIFSCLWLNKAFFAFMPKTTVNKDSQPYSGEYKIGVTNNLVIFSVTLYASS